MSTEPTRRDILRIAAVAAGGIAVGLFLPGCHGPDARTAARADKSGEFAPNAWVTVTSDNRIVFWLDRVEMGQGTMTSHATILAEELEVDPRKVQVEFAPANRAYDNPDGEIGFQLTGGSTSVKTSWDPLRAAGATARDMLRGAAAETWGVPIEQCAANDGMVTHAPTGRHATYGELARAAGHQPVPDVRLKTPDQFRWIGKPLVRFDARRKVDGSGTYGIDVKLPGLLTAVVLRPPALRASARRFDASAAKAQPGVVDVFEVPSGVAVVATSYWRAAAAARLVKVEWDGGKLAGVGSKAIAKQYRERVLLPGKVVRKIGDLEQGFSVGGRAIEAIYEAPFLAHATMEPQNFTAHVTDDRCELWGPTQSAALAQQEAWRITGLPRERILMHTTLIGGGFGRRLQQDYVAEAVHVSRHLKRPVKVVWSREDDMRHDFYRPLSVHHLKGALDAHGNVAAWRHRIVAQSMGVWAAGDWAPAVLPNAMAGAVGTMLSHTVGTLLADNIFPDPTSLQGAAEFEYAMPNLRVEYQPLEPGVPAGAWRSVGNSQNAFVVESFLDELARSAGVDPYHLRRRLLANVPRELATLDLAARAAGWSTPPPKGIGRGIAHWKCFGTPCSLVCDASVEGKVVRMRRIVAAVDCGQVINPDLVKAQIESAIVFGLSAALKQRITIEDGRVVEGNFHEFPLLRMHETPPIEVHLVPSHEKPTGVGEVGVPPAAPALANAVFAATGRRIRVLPIEHALAEAT